MSCGILTNVKSITKKLSIVNTQKSSRKGLVRKTGSNTPSHLARGFLRIKTSGKKRIFFTIDKIDEEKVRKYKWYVVRNRYIQSFKSTHSSHLARFILNAPKHLEVDHIDGNFKNNRRKNLRLCTHAENMLNQPIYTNNKHGYKGVEFLKKWNRYRALIRVNGKQYRKGHYKTVEEAAYAYNELAKKHHGKFARLNKL